MVTDQNIIIIIRVKPRTTYMSLHVRPRLNKYIIHYTYILYINQTIIILYYYNLYLISLEFKSRTFM